MAIAVMGKGHDGWDEIRPGSPPARVRPTGGRAYRGRGAALARRAHALKLQNKFALVFLSLVPSFSIATSTKKRNATCPRFG